MLLTNQYKVMRDVVLTTLIYNLYERKVLYNSVIEIILITVIERVYKYQPKSRYYI